jgi:hypothetical protein
VVEAFADRIERACPNIAEHDAKSGDMESEP